MNREHWQRVREVLEPALELDPETVSGWLDEHCPAELREEIEGLIAASRDGESLLDEPVFRADSVLEAGTEIGPYVIDSLIGVGGMGVVYKAEDARLRRPVAIKLLTVAGDAVDLLAEARAASALNHPNIVTIHDVLEFRRSPAIIMEYVEGPTLERRLDDGPVSASRAPSCASQIAAALVAAHDARILHCDLKPANVIERPDGLIKVLDFGIAQRLRRDEPRDAAVLGTEHFAAPEQIVGERLDERTDIYAFGALLRAMLLGEAAGKQSGPLPGPWRPILERCLQADPAARFASMGEVAQRISALEKRVRTRTQFGIATAATLLLAAAAAVAGLADRDSTPMPPTFDSRGLTGIEYDRRFPAISPSGRQIAFSTAVEGELHLRVQDRNALYAAHLGQEGRHAAWSPDGIEIAFRSDRDGGGVFVLNLETGLIRRLTDRGFHPVWAPDGTRVVFASEGFERPEERPTSSSYLSVLDLVSGEVREVDLGNEVTDAIQPVWSHDGAWLAFWGIDRAGGRSVWTVPASGGGATRITEAGVFAWNPAWHPDGWLYWASDRAGTMNAWRGQIDPGTGALRGQPQLVALPTSYAAYFSFSDSGDLAFSAQSSAASIWKMALDSDAPAERLTPRTREILHPSVSPDGEWLVAFEQSPRDNLVVLRTDGSDFRYLTTDDARDRGPVWSPLGDQIAFGSTRGGDYQIWAVRPDGSNLVKRTALETLAHSPTWAPTGDTIAWFTLGYRPMVSNADGTGSRGLPAPPTPGFRPTSWSPDGRQLAGVLRTLDGQRLGSALLDLETGSYRRVERPCESIQWMPDGARLLCVSGRDFYFIDVATGGSSIAREVTYPPDTRFDVSPDGRWLYAALRESQPQVWIATPR